MLLLGLELCTVREAGKRAVLGPARALQSWDPAVWAD